MTLAKIKLAVLGRVWQIIGIAFYLSGVALWIILSVSGHKVSKIRPFSQTLLAVLAVFLGAAVGFGVMRLGHFLFLRGKKLIAKANMLKAEELLTHDRHPLVLYLRSFSDDQMTSATPTAYEMRGIELPMLSTEEEHLAKAVNDVGPFFAIAKPFETPEIQETLPPLGAIRVSSDPNSWQETVSSLMLRAQMVIFRLGEGEGLWWEIEEAIKIVRPERIIFLIPDDDSTFEVFRKKFQPFVPYSIPDLVCEDDLPTTIDAILYFGPDGKPYISPLKDAEFRNNEAQPLRPILRIALKPVFEQLNLKWTPPPIPLNLIWSVPVGGLAALGSLLWPIFSLLMLDDGGLVPRSVSVVMFIFSMSLSIVIVIRAFLPFLRGIRILYGAIKQFNPKKETVTSAKKTVNWEAEDIRIIEFYKTTMASWSSGKLSKINKQYKELGNISYRRFTRRYKAVGSSTLNRGQIAL